MKKIIYKLYMIFCMLQSLTALAQLRQGDILITHSPQQAWAYTTAPLNGLNCGNIGLNSGAYVVSLLHAGNTSNINVTANGERYTWTPMTPGNNKPAWITSNNWVESQLGRIFGITIENSTTFYVANSSIYSGEGNNAARHDNIWQLTPPTATNQNPVVSIAYSFNGNDVNRGIGNIKYFTWNGGSYMAVTWWEDGAIYILQKNGSTWSPIGHLSMKFGQTNANPNVVPYGIAVRNVGGALKLFYGKFDMTNLNPLNTEVWMADLAITTTAAISNEQLSFSSPAKNPASYISAVCSNSAYPAVSDISFSSDNNKLVLAQQSLCCSHQISSHNALVYEYCFSPSPINTGSLLPAGSASAGILPISPSNPPHPSSDLFYARNTNAVGGVCYWNNILFTNSIQGEGGINNAALKCDTTVLFTSDLIYFGGIGINPPTTEVTSNFPSNSNLVVYGFQGMPSNNNFLSTQDAFNKSLKVDVDDDFEKMDKWNLGDIEAYNMPLECQATPCNICDCGQFESFVITSSSGPSTTYPPGSTPNITFTQGLASGFVYANYKCNPADESCIVRYTWDVISNGNTIIPGTPSTTNYFDFTQLNGLLCGNYLIKVTPTCKGKVCPAEYVQVAIIGCVPSCNCGNFSSITLNNAPWWNSSTSSTPPTLSFTAGALTGLLTAYYQCNPSTESCIASYNWQVTNLAGAVAAPAITGNSQNFNLSLLNGLVCGSYLLTVIPVCGTNTCLKVSIPINIECPPACNCGSFNSITLNNAPWWNNSTSSTPPNLSFTAGTPVSGILNASYQCSPANDLCITSYSWQVNTVTGAPVSLPSSCILNNSSFDLACLHGLCGTYRVTITPKCGSLNCTPKSFTVKIDCDPPTICSCTGNYSITQSAVNVSAQSNINNASPFSAATTGFTLTSSPSGLVSEVRVLIDEFRLTTITGNENCIECKNKPVNWANINSATMTGVINQLYSYPPLPQKDVRELVFNNGGNPFLLNGNVLNLNLGLPAVTGLNCCMLKAEVCVKFIIRDIYCCETEIMKCFTFNLQ